MTALGRGALAAVLEAGADDYIAKPFELDALEARIAVAEFSRRRSEGAAP